VRRDGGLDFRRISFGLDFVFLRRKSPVRTRVPLRPYGSRGRSHARERRLLLLLQVVFSVRLFADQSEVRPRGLDGVGFPGEPDRWDLDARFELAARLLATESAARRGARPGIKQDALPISRLQEPIEGSAVQVPLRGASQAAEEEAR